jgi:hypothetical protein
MGARKYLFYRPLVTTKGSEKRLRTCLPTLDFYLRASTVREYMRECKRVSSDSEMAQAPMPRLIATIEN